MTQSAKPAILIVEDERIVAKDLQQTLAGLGYDAFAVASSASEALARSAEKCPDLVLMDIRIKGRRDGIETAGLLRQKFGVPIIYLTAHGDDDTVDRATKTEPYGYLLKPVKDAELRSAIEVTLFRHEMEQRLRQRERWFSTTLRSIADAVVAVDCDSRITFLNPAAESLVGVKAEEVVGRHAHEVLELAGWDHGADRSPLATALRTGQPVEVTEVSLRNQRTGSQHLIDDRAAPVADEKEVFGAVMVFRDVTEQKRLQRQVELSDRLASLGTMAAGVAHEVNNPLAVVVACGELLAGELAEQQQWLQTGGPLETQQRSLESMTETLQSLQSAASRITRIIADLQVFSRPPVSEVPGCANLRRCAEWALCATAREFRHRARVITQFGDAPLAKADEAKLGQVILNLLLNAAHAIAPGNLERNQVRLSTGSDAQGRAVLEVADSGPGIPAELQQRIFEPFFTTKDVGIGAGLGLSICHGVVRSFGGEISVTSKPGEGAAFRVVLPAFTPDLGPARSPAMLRGRILVVDDEEIVRGVLARILAGHEIHCTGSAQEALELIRHQRFDLILSDLVMPSMTGMEFYEILLARQPELAQRVVFLSGGALTPKVAEFLHVVPNLIIDKPFEARYLQDKLQELLARHQRRGA
jgi:PAS domain S-box-containing protein